MSNAVKYSPSGAAIEVEAAERRRGEVVIAVTDHGIGIPAGDIERLFERYHRGSNVSGIVGTGVGLYLVKMAVERHGGRVEVTSTEGAGSRFSIHLPAMRKVAALERRSADVGAASVRGGADLRSRRDCSGVIAGRRWASRGMISLSG